MYIMYTAPLAMFGLGPPELIVIGLVLVLLFGSRLPRVARSLGQSLLELKRGVREINRAEGQDDE